MHIYLKQRIKRKRREKKGGEARREGDICSRKRERGRMRMEEREK